MLIFFNSLLRNFIINTYICSVMILYGASGHARVIRDILEAQGYAVSSVIDDNPSLSSFDGIAVEHSATTLFPTIADNSDSNSFSDCSDCQPIIISIGNNRVRKQIAERLSSLCQNILFGLAIHPSAVVSPSAVVEAGTVVMQGAILQASSVIGKHCIINTGASVDHECHIGNYVHISPHATLCGNVSVGEGTWIGAGSTIIQGVKIGSWSVIGAGSVVTHDIPDNCLAVGTPCKAIRIFNNISHTGG